MVFYDSFRRIIDIRDLYTIGFDGLDTLGMEGFFDAQKDKEEKEFSHIIIGLGIGCSKLLFIFCLLI
jgi:hypothetical protein